MPQIPLYTESVQRTTQEPIQRDSGAAGAAVGQAIASMGSAVFQAGGNIAHTDAKQREKQAALNRAYSEKKKKLKEDAEISDYEVAQRDFITNLEEKKNDAIMNKGVGYADIYEKVVAPEIAKFGEKLKTRGYSDDAIAEIGQRWGIDAAEIRQNEIIQREKMELTDYADRIQKQGDSVLAQGDFDGADEIYGSLSNVVGVDAVNEMKSLGRYNYYTVGMQSLEEQRLDGVIDDKQYFDALNELRDESKTSGMELNHQRSVDISVNAKILNFKGRRVTQRDKSLSDFKKLRDRDEVTAIALEELELTAGPEWSSALEKTIDSTLSVKATSDKDADKAYTAVKSYQNGEISAGKALRIAEKVRGQYGEMSVYLIGRVAEDQAAKNGTVVAYDDNWNGVPSKVTSTTTDFVDNLGYYMAHQKKGEKAGYFAQKFIQYDKWRDQNPDAAEEDYIIWRNELFKKDAQDFIMQQTAPQQQSATSVTPDFDNMTDAELEAYINE